MKYFARLSDASCVVYEISVIQSLSKESIYNLTNAIYPITIVAGRTVDLPHDSNADIQRHSEEGRSRKRASHPRSNNPGAVSKTRTQIRLMQVLACHRCPIYASEWEKVLRVDL